MQSSSTILNAFHCLWWCYSLPADVVLSFQQASDKLCFGQTGNSNVHICNNNEQITRFVLL